MSFSEDFRTELWTEEPPKNTCCRRAMVYGMLFCAELSGSVFYFDLPNPEIAADVQPLFETVLQHVPAAETVSRAGHTFGRMTFVSRGAAGLLQRGLMSDLPLEKLLNFSCEHCKKYFLRGVFLAAGSMADPRGNYHLEIACRDSATARRLAQTLGEIGCPPKEVRRKNGLHLYYKSSEAMEDLLSYLGAHKTLFSLINCKIEHDIRNNVNRATNCVAQNIRKSVVAASAQLEAIERLRGSALWDKLPAALRETAELRLENQDASLGELALIHQPPISKSGLNHRLQKLMELSGELDS